MVIRVVIKIGFDENQHLCRPAGLSRQFFEQD